jgi:6-phosphogluconate dehydrogenase (decarboxylating)
MYHYNIKSTINDKPAHYDAANARVNQPRAQVWIITPHGDVLVKSIDQTTEVLTIAQVTIDAEGVSSAIKSIEKSTNVLCSSDNLSEIYSLDINTEHTPAKANGYTLCIRLDEEHKSLIEDTFKGKFIDYKELTNYFAGFSIDISLKEALLNLISSLDQRQSFSPSV